MKRVFTMLLLGSLFLSVATKTNAQTKYYVYDNEKQGSFNILLTYEDVSLETVSFSYNGKWVAFNYKDYISKESSRPEKGFTCMVVDGTGQNFFVDYRRKSNMVVVKNLGTQETWRLYPRK